LISIREAARLMGVNDHYEIPNNYNDGYHIFGDGLAVPAVNHIARHLLDSLAESVPHKPSIRRKIAA
jgi:DNA (cytosine-5)-methyltransferase 1